MNSVDKVVVSGSFDDLRSSQVRFLEEAMKFGELHVILWDDNSVLDLHGKPPKFPLEERLYFLESIRYVHQVHVPQRVSSQDALPVIYGLKVDLWVVSQGDDNPHKRAFCDAAELNYYVIAQSKNDEFHFHNSIPLAENTANLGKTNKNKRILVTGCYDWLHSGHVRFFEEVSQLGDLYVVIGSDVNVRLLKGKGHPLFSQTERLYLVQSIRFVKGAFISTGKGWMDAEPQIPLIQPDIYAVNEDGDKPEKRSFCADHGLDYVVLKRLPKEGLPKRESSILRGF